MYRLFFALVTVIATATGAAAAAGPAPTDAPANNTTTAAPSTSTAAPTASTAPTTGPPGGAGETVVAQVDEHLRILSYGFQNGVFRFRIQNTDAVAHRITVVDTAPVDGEGAATGNVKQVTVMPGTQTVEIRTRGDAAVSISSRASIQSGRYVYLSKESDTNPFESFGGTGGLLAGIGSTICFAFAGAWFVTWKESDGVEVAG